jgi:hypothetical protein
MGKALGATKSTWRITTVSSNFLQEIRKNPPQELNQL